MLKFAIIGYDHVHVLKYLPCIAHHPDVSLVAIAAMDGNKEMAKKASKEYRCRYFESIESVFSLKGLDAVYVGSTPAQHLDIVREAAKEGVHVLCDKPLATNLYDADEMISAADTHRINLMVPFNPRFQLSVMQLKEMVEKGMIGDLLYINSVKYGKIPSLIAGMDTAWFFDVNRAGCGGFGDIGIHSIDAICWLSGGKPSKVFAKIGRHIHNDIPLDDIGSAFIEFDNGVIANLNSGWANPARYPSWLDVKFEVLGSEKVVAINKPYHDFKVYNEESMEAISWWRTDVSMLVNEFIQSILEEREPSITARDARRALEVTLAAYQSSTTGEEVMLPL